MAVVENTAFQPQRFENALNQALLRLKNSAVPHTCGTPAQCHRRNTTRQRRRLGKTHHAGTLSGSADCRAGAP